MKESKIMKITKKVLSVFLSVLIMLSICSVSMAVFAEEYREEQEVAAYLNAGISTQALDILIPVINSVTGNSGYWTNKPITLTVNATDYGSAGLAPEAYSFDGGNTWQASKSKTFYKNQTVSIKVRDAAGNKSITKTVEITKIDNG